jgi:hypothetical protein
MVGIMIRSIINIFFILTISVHCLANSDEDIQSEEIKSETSAEAIPASFEVIKLIPTCRSFYVNHPDIDNSPHACNKDSKFYPTRKACEAACGITGI